MDCEEAGCSKTPSGNISHAYKCKTVPKCEQCSVRLDMLPVIHDYNCSHCVKCIQCTTRLDIHPVVHSFNCPYCPKCQYCNCRLDMYGGIHKPDCPTIARCLSCRVREGQEHLESCDAFVRFQIRQTPKPDLEQSECPICGDDATDCETTCGHKFHKKCLGQWLKKKKICPYCREEVLEIWVK